MKKSIALMALVFSSMAFADQASTITCSGKNIELVEKSPYLGENSKFSQSLYILKLKKSDESANTAYFLDISHDVGPHSEVYISGKNEVGGSFDLVTSFPQDVSDGTVVKRVSKGILKYSHGPLKGKEKVDCVIE